MEKPDPLLPHGGYRKLRSYKVAEVVSDATVVFGRRFFAPDRRITKQMVRRASRPDDIKNSLRGE